MGSSRDTQLPPKNIPALDLERTRDAANKNDIEVQCTSFSSRNLKTDNDLAKSLDFETARQSLAVQVVDPSISPV